MGGPSRWASPCSVRVARLVQAGWVDARLRHLLIKRQERRSVQHQLCGGVPNGVQRPETSSDHATEGRGKLAVPAGVRGVLLRCAGRRWHKRHRDGSLPHVHRRLPRDRRSGGPYQRPATAAGIIHRTIVPKEGGVALPPAKRIEPPERGSSLSLSRLLAPA